MASNRRRRGDYINHEEPDWRALERIVGLELAGWFMWMGEIELRDRTRLHVYKHRYTRRYLYADLSGRCYGYEQAPGPSDPAYYRQISQHQVVWGVFGIAEGPESPGIWPLTIRERAALGFVRRNASYELLEPGDPSPLEPGKDADGRPVIPACNGLCDPVDPFAPRWSEPEGFQDDEIPF